MQLSSPRAALLTGTILINAALDVERQEGTIRVGAAASTGQIEVASWVIAAGVQILAARRDGIIACYGTLRDEIGHVWLLVDVELAEDGDKESLAHI